MPVDTSWTTPLGSNGSAASGRILCQWILFIFLGAQVAGGVIRWFLDMAGASTLVYLPNAGMLLCIALMVGSDVVHNKTTPGAIFVMVLVLLSSIVGLVSTGNLNQVAFGAWVLTPFFFGLISASALLEPWRFQVPLLVVMFLATSGGVIAHEYIPFPWVGVSYQIGGVELEGAREWHTGETQRLSGLARSSFDVAGQILVSAALLSLQVKRGIWRALIWSLCAYSISLSTSKGILLALAMTAYASECLIRRNTAGLRWTFFAGALWVFGPLLMGWTMDWSGLARTDIDNPIYGSFLDRMNDMWPKAWDLSTTHGLPPFGRGLGGIGAAQSLFEPALFNAGDNIFAYCWVIVGVLSVPLFSAGFLALFKMCKWSESEKIRTTLVLAVAVNWYGGVSNILEHALLAFAFGMVCRVCAMSLTDETLFEQNQNTKHL